MLHCFSRVIFGNVGFSLKRAKRFATTVRPLISVSHIDLRLLLLAHQKRNFSTQKVPLRIVLIGPPGSGKGTQALKIERDFGPTPISTGHLLRAAAAGNSEFARRLREILERGELVPDDIVFTIVKDVLTTKEMPLVMNGSNASLFCR
jgi:hypothetical protein